MKNLFIVNTYFQLITCLNLAVNEFSSDENSIILTDRSKGMYEKIDDLKSLGIFEDVLYVETKTKCTGSKIKKYIMYLTKRDYFCNLNLYIDKLFWFNYDIFTCSVFDSLININPKMRCSYYDEGFICYVKKNKMNIINSFIRSILFKKRITKRVDSFYLYHPELLTYNIDVSVKKIPTLNKNDNRLMCCFEKIFGTCSLNIKEKYVFFEESFFCDNKGIDDMIVIDSILEIVGSENLAVKLHPRNLVDRFSKNGVCVLKTNVPWEVLVMLNDFSDKCLLTITSGSVLASILYFDQSIDTYLLYNCTDKKSDMLTKKYLLYLELLKKNNGTHCLYVPDSLDDFKKNLEWRKQNDKERIKGNY